MRCRRDCRSAWTRHTKPLVRNRSYRKMVRIHSNVCQNLWLNLPREVTTITSNHLQKFGNVEEALKSFYESAIETVKKETGVKVDYMVGTMIEIPRAALIADEVAQEAEFFSFGTNDLTQMAFGYSRDDAGKFLSEYLDRGILTEDPFQVLDQSGVGQLVEMAVKKGRSTNKNLKIGICGEHGGEPKSVAFCHRIGMNYVSCSPYRVPIARLAAAQEAIREK